jgi:hypothetical protein
MHATNASPYSATKKPGVVLLAALLVAATASLVCWRAAKQATANSDRAACLGVLAVIESAKMSYQEDHAVTNGTRVTEKDIEQYVEGGFIRLKCPSGGKISLNPIGVSAECSIHGPSGI